MRAAAYVRVSTEDQAREGFSLAAQERACRTRAESEGWEWTECFRDEGISGATLDRPGLMAAIDADVDILIVKAQDRLSRDTIGYLTILQDAKAKLLSLDEGWLATDEDGEFVGTIFAARSQWERKRIARRIRDGLAEKARQGFHVGPVPLGYTRTDARLQPTPDAPHIVALFERYAGGGISLKDLASWARLHGLPGQDRLSVRKLLQNATYAGRVVYHNRGPDRAEYDGQHAPIVSLQLFDRVQAQLRYRRRGSSTVHWGRQTYPLTGIAHCAAGGHPLSGARSSNHNARYMRCRATLTKGRTACPQRMVPADELESQIGAYFDGFTLPKGEVAAVMDLLAPKLPRATRRPRAACGSGSASTRPARLTKRSTNVSQSDCATIRSSSRPWWTWSRPRSCSPTSTSSGMRPTPKGVVRWRPRSSGRSPWTDVS